MDPGYVVSWISGFSEQLIAQYFDQRGVHLCDPTHLKVGGSDYFLFKSGYNYFTIISSGNDIIYNEFRIGGDWIGEAATFKLNELKEGFLYAGHGTKILDNKAVAVWYGEYEDDYDIYGRIIDYHSYMYKK
jgi:hypothetical protein